MPIAEWAGRWWCGLRGHDAMLAFERGRMFLRCASCGHEGAGLQVTGKGPRVTQPGDPRRHRLSRLHPVRRRA